jgi:hypothetical protein
VIWHKPGSMQTTKPIELPKTGDRWRPRHRVPHQNNKTITIRRFIAGERKKP